MPRRKQQSTHRRRVPAFRIQTTGYGLQEERALIDDSKAAGK